MPAISERLQQHRGAKGIRPHVAGDLIHGLPDTDFGGVMKYSVNIFKRALDQFGVAHVALQEFGVRVQMWWQAVAVDLRDDGIEDAYLVAGFHQCVHQMRTYEASATGYENVHGL